MPRTSNVLMKRPAQVATCTGYEILYGFRVRKLGLWRFQKSQSRRFSEKGGSSVSASQAVP
jgi:hypothetical protein